MPHFFHVNWFRKDNDGNFLWPGFGQNMRVLRWIVERVRGRTNAAETPIGWIPDYEDIDWRGLEFSKDNWDELMSIDNERFKQQVFEHEELFNQLSTHLPAELSDTRELLLKRL